MSDQCKYNNSFNLIKDFGCEFFEVVSLSGIKNVGLCHVNVSDLERMASNLTETIMDDSWMLNLDRGARRAYERTLQETSSVLVAIFNSASTSSTIAADFGELMVSMGASKCLEVVFGHSAIPLAELWKPQLKQNEGFDFHTVCPAEKLHFGEAKFSSSANPHGKAFDQIEKFILAEKHLRDYVHLVSLCTEKPIEHLNDDRFGIVAAFSVNTEDPLAILKNALNSVQDRDFFGKVDSIYLVGVSYDS